MQTCRWMKLLLPLHKVMCILPPLAEIHYIDGECTSWKHMGLLLANYRTFLTAQLIMWRIYSPYLLAKLLEALSNNWTNIRIRLAELWGHLMMAQNTGIREPTSGIKFHQSPAHWVYYTEKDMHSMQWSHIDCVKDIHFNNTSAAIATVYERVTYTQSWPWKQ